jgi:hypothetical protein
MGNYIIAGLTFVVVFILFLVISRTLNNMVNLLIKIEYSLQKEYDLRQEAFEVRRLMEEEAKKELAPKHVQKDK